METPQDGKEQVWEAERRPVWPTRRLRRRMVGRQSDQVGKGQAAQGLIGRIRAPSSSRQ